MSDEIGIIFCCSSEEKSNPLEAMEHLKNNEEIYWSTPFGVRGESLPFPIIGLIHITKDAVRYKCTIRNIKKYDSSDHLNPLKKPARWIKEQSDNPRQYRSTLIFEKIEPFDYDTKELKDTSGQRIMNPPRGYQKIILP
jgi:hypothetical protein